MFQKFVCQKCGSKKLCYEKWISSKEPIIIHDNDHIEYALAEIDEDDILGVEYGFVCGDCRHPLYYQGRRVQDEEDLKCYLSHSYEEIQQMNDDYYELEAETMEVCDDSVLLLNGKSLSNEKR